MPLGTFTHRGRFAPKRQRTAGIISLKKSRTAARSTLPNQVVSGSKDSRSIKVTDRKPRVAPPLTISRPEMLVDGSDRAFRSLVHGLFAFLARHEAVRAGHGARIGLVGIEYTVLISIGHLGVHESDVSVNRIAEHLYLSGAFVTTVTNKLLQRKLIHKTPDPNDRRRVRLEISEKGWALLAGLAPVQRQVNNVQFDCLSAAEFKQLAKMIDRLIDSSDRALRLQAYFEDRSGGPAPALTEGARKERSGLQA
jgi:MarR family transcriptional regulator, organic hydroperoxide resistance regulator